MTDFSEVYNLYFKDIYKYVLSLCRNEALAEEVTQETFFKALKNLDSFRGQCKLYVWLCQIAKNTYFSMKDRKDGAYDEIDDMPSDDNLEGRLLTKESAFELHHILHRLAEPYKEVFLLRVFGELPFQQIATLFCKTESWARVTYHRAKLMIKEELK